MLNREQLEAVLKLKTVGEIPVRTRVVMTCIREKPEGVVG